MDNSSVVTLNRLLSRLDHTLLSPDSEQLQRLRGSQYERNKVGANIEHARTLLLTLEKQSSTLRIQTQRQQIQSGLQSKRELIKQLNARLQELNQLGDEDEDEDNDDSEGEDGEDGDEVMASYAPARKDTQDGIDAGGSDGPPIPNPPPESELRSRRPLQASDNRDAASTSAREQLFANRPQTKQDSSLSHSETMLSHNRTEQESLTTSLIGLAKALKDSSIQFSSSLEAEKDVLKRAEGGLDKSSQGMEAAGRKMSMLRRMSEGQGWWGRIKLYAFIFGLWVACFLVVFVGPKIRL
jgi:hypothetical protein